MRDYTKFTLDEMLSLGIWERVDQPETVYHLTHRRNLDSIIADGKIKTGEDYVCWFSPSPDQMLTYLELTGAYKGRSYWDYDGKVHTAPPVIPEEYIVLELSPRCTEPLYWYRETHTGDLLKWFLIDADGKSLTGAERERAIQGWQALDDARIAHYGAMKYKRDSFNVLELADIIANANN